MTTVQDSIEKSLDAIREAARPVPIPRHDGINTGSLNAELERFLASSQRLYDQQREKILALESDHEKARAALIDRYRVRLRNLEHEAEEALRECDDAYERTMADQRRMFKKLAAMREG